MIKESATWSVSINVVSCGIEVRAATARDAPVRLALLKAALAEHSGSEFVALFFQESTLQGVVLCCAALFIFCGMSLWGCALVPLAAALLSRAIVEFALQAQFDLLQMGMQREAVGLVAVAGAAVVGTVSVTPAGRLDALAVARAARRRGAGWALVRAAKAAAARAGMRSLDALVKEPQAAARALLEADGWEPSGPSDPSNPSDAILRLTVQLDSRPPLRPDWAGLVAEPYSCTWAVQRCP